MRSTGYQLFQALPVRRQGLNNTLLAALRHGAHINQIYLMLHEPGFLAHVRFVIIRRQAPAQIVHVASVAVEIAQLRIQKFYGHSAPSNTLRIFSRAVTDRL